MDVFTPGLLQAGMIAMIGKGVRSKEVVEAIRKYRAVYFLAYAGCGALVSTYVKSKRLVAYRDLGTEAVHALEVEDFPCFVGIDSRGKVISPNY
jgi:fumarate hydratase subunit beta